MSALLMSLLPVVASAVGGYLVRHYNLFGSPPSASAGTPSQSHVDLLSVLTGKGKGVVRQILLDAAQAAYQRVIADAAKGLQSGSNSAQDSQPASPAQKG